MSESREEGPKDPETLGPWTAPGDFPATFPEKAEKNPGENPGVSVFFMERETGFEPATSTLARSHSTTELFPLNWVFI